ncbi:AAA family ATPase [Nonomuraea glycinis]|uniref:AAA family ATPase n=1 Tax=Nonomuraea glycinis TaxID=2047744 RepID=UPI002E15EADA|nr:AAA family ATPase [Nonomuraea glycinis]
MTTLRMPLWDRSRLLAGLAVVYLVLTWQVMADFEGIMSYPEALRVIAEAHPWIFWLLGAEALRQAHGLIGERWSGYRRFWSGRVFGGFARWSRRRFSAGTRFRAARALKIAFWLVTLSLALGAVLGTSPFFALLRVPERLPVVLPVLVIVLAVAGLARFLSRGGVETYRPGDITTRFADVWGQDHVLEQLRECVVRLDRPGEIERRGGHLSGGVLLWGPPGTGKTLLAEAVAGETGRPYVVVDSGAFTGVLKMKALFRRVRKLALRHGGVVVLFDEADALGRRAGPARQGRRGSSGASGSFSSVGSSGSSTCHGLAYLPEETRSVLAFRGRREVREPQARDDGTLRALLTELSALGERRGLVDRPVRRLLGMRPEPPPNHRVLLLMTTNRPDALDEALLKPGRIDRVLKVGHPSTAGRAHTYRGYFDRVRHELTDRQIDKLATITPYATGATIKDLVNEALISALRDGREAIAWPDVLRARRFQRLGSPGDAEHLDRERHTLAVHEACHAVVAYATRRHLEIDLATIEKGADHLGPVGAAEPKGLRWKSEVEEDIMISLAALAGERMFFGDSSSAVSGDLHAATVLTAHMETAWGMGAGVTSLPALRELEITAAPGPGDGGGPPAERIEATLARLLERTERLLLGHRRDVLSVAHALETYRTLTGDDVVAIIERSRGPLVDGARYAADELYRELEDYHRDAATARQRHGRVERALPRPAAAGEVVTARPQFVPMTGSYVSQPRPAPVAPAGAPGRRLWVAVAGAFTLVVLALFVGLAVTGALTGSPASGTATSATSTGAGPGVALPVLLLVLFIVVVAVIVGAGLAAVAVKGVRAKQLRAERERDQAHARAQLLAAALDPDTAMRLLGYDGNGRRESAI